ncbi:uncharacterized protein EI90DRAFT_3026182 [Cantharellus anzutake]|uniref:uncharacterized protein n=1 Tax=Cantharellus anzutake TaxID=1750568 RepID=UPI0019042B33|nr:uncharacterized protein EI90DRAFT_3026182 [Cantharellus anzutake]KAF8308238.1 hypothetical protein EI90DRAFT_3026182 [Cantharellus anzutake]
MAPNENAVHAPNRVVAPNENAVVSQPKQSRRRAKAERKVNSSCGRFYDRDITFGITRQACPESCRSPDLNLASSSMPPNRVVAPNENAVPAPESCRSPDLNPASSSVPPNRVMALNENAVVSQPKQSRRRVKADREVNSSCGRFYDHDINHDDMVNRKYQKELQPGNIVIVTFNNSARLEG